MSADNPLIQQCIKDFTLDALPGWKLLSVLSVLSSGVGFVITVSDRGILSSFVVGDAVSARPSSDIGSVSVAE